MGAATYKSNYHTGKDINRMLNAHMRDLIKVFLQLLTGGRKSFIIDGEKYYAKSIFLSKLSIGIHRESYLDGTLKAALHTKEGAFLDVGANNGQTLIKLLSLDKNREYVGFEPQLDCCFNIEQFIKLNKLKNHTILPVGLSDNSQVLQLYKRFDDTDETASTISGFRPDDFYTTKQLIFVSKGDDLVSTIDLPNISTIKIDVEGGEMEVIDGLKEVLLKHKPYIFFEVLNHFLVVTGQQLDSDTIEFRERRNQQMEKTLRELGYCIFNVLPGNRLNEINKIQPKVSNDLNITDYVAIHSSIRNDFTNKFDGVISSHTT